MKHLPAWALVMAALCAPASTLVLADDLPPAQTEAAPRFTMVPAEGGFVRLDTQTGLVSHCRRETAAADSSWRCAAIPEDTLRSPDRLSELSEEIQSLGDAVAALRMRVDALERARKDEAPPLAAAPSDEEMNRALDFSEELMRRFFGLVQEMKRGPDDRT